MMAGQRLYDVSCMPQKERELWVFCRTMTTPHVATRALRSSRCRDNGAAQWQSQQRPAKTDTPSPTCCTESRGLSTGFAGPGNTPDVAGRPHPCSSPAVTQANAVAACRQTSSVAAHAHGQKVVGPSVSMAVPAQPASQSMQSNRTDTTPQPAAVVSAATKESAPNLEGCALTATACNTCRENLCRLSESPCSAGPSLYLCLGPAGH